MMKGSRCLLSALLLLGVTLTLASHNDEESMQQSEIDFDREASKNDFDVQSIKNSRLIYARENRHHDAMPEEVHDRTKRGLRKLKKKFKKIGEKVQRVRGKINRVIGAPGSDRRRIISGIAARIGASG